MTAYTSSGTGNWSSSSTWGGLGVPGNGDTASIGHAVTVDADTIVGTSPAPGTNAITITSGGSITIADNVSLTIRGDTTAATPGSATTVLAMGQGSVLEFDGSLAASPSAATYKFQLGTANGARARVSITGVSGNRAIIRSNAGGGNGYFTRSTFTNTGFMVIAYCDFLRIGDSSNKFAKPSLSTSSGTSRFTFDHCTFDACGTWDCNDGATPGNAAWIGLTNCTFKNSVGGNVTLGTATAPTSQRDVKNCVFDKLVAWTSTAGFTIEDNLFQAAYSVSGSNTWASWARNLVYRSSSVQDLVNGDCTDTYFLQDHGTANPHFVAPNQNLNITFDGCVFEYTGSNTAGDCILIPSPSAAKTYTVTQCIVLPNGAGLASGSLISALGNANAAFSCTHNTGLGGGNSQALVTIGETYAGYAGMLTAFKSNLVWKPSGTSDYKLFQTGTTSDYCSAANCDYNTGWNLNGAGYSVTMTGSPGAHDVDTDPGFQQGGATFVDWDTARGGAGTIANALSELAKVNDDSGANPDYTIANLLAWMRGAYAPTTLTLRGAAHDAGDIGAVAVATAGSGAATATPASLSGSGTVGAAGISGTGAVTITPAAMSGSGTETVSGTGALTATPASLSGSGTETVSGSGNATLPAIALSGSGTSALGISGTGAVTVTAPALAGSGTETITASGGVTVAVAQSGSGTSTASGSGGVTLTLTLAGTGSAAGSGTGGVTAAPTLSGSGTSTASGSGGVTVAIGESGSGQVSQAGVGAMTMTAALAGSGSLTVSGSGSVSVAPLLAGSLAGTGAALASGTGAATVAASLSGTGAISEAGSGAATIAPALSGSGAITVAGTGAATLAPTLAGSGSVPISGSGAATVALSLSGIATSTAASTSTSGKYKAEHDAALADLATVTGFAAEHASAYRDLMDAGV